MALLLRLVNIALNAPYISFTIWPEAALASEVEHLVNVGEHAAAHAILYLDAHACQLN